MRVTVKNTIIAGAIVTGLTAACLGWRQLKKPDPWIACASRAADERHFGEQSDWGRFHQPITEGVFGDKGTKEAYKKKSDGFTIDQRIIFGKTSGTIPDYVTAKCGQKPHLSKPTE